MWSFLKEDAIPMGLFLLGAFALVVIPCLGFISVAQYQQCVTLTFADPAHNYRWTFWTGCLVQLDNGRWIDPSDQSYQLWMEEGTGRKMEPLPSHKRSPLPRLRPGWQRGEVSA